MILGIGIDIVKNDRIKKIFARFGESFVQRILSPVEILDYKKRNPKKKIQYLASRFAAKEAIAKALGIGIGKISFKNIEIKKKSSGAPYVNITNLTSLGLNTKIDIMISLSDEIDYTAAFVIINKKS